MNGENPPTSSEGYTQLRGEIDETLDRLGYVDSSSASDGGGDESGRSGKHKKRRKLRGSPAADLRGVNSSQETNTNNNPIPTSADKAPGRWVAVTPGIQPPVGRRFFISTNPILSQSSENAIPKSGNQNNNNPSISENLFTPPPRLERSQKNSKVSVSGTSGWDEDKKGFRPNTYGAREGIRQGSSNTGNLEGGIGGNEGGTPESTSLPSKAKLKSIVGGESSGVGTAKSNSVGGSNSVKPQVPFPPPHFQLAGNRCFGASVCSMLHGVPGVIEKITAHSVANPTPFTICHSFQMRPFGSTTPCSVAFPLLPGFEWGAPGCAHEVLRVLHTTSGCLSEHTWRYNFRRSYLCGVCPPTGSQVNITEVIISLRKELFVGEGCVGRALSRWASGEIPFLQPKNPSNKSHACLTSHLVKEEKVMMNPPKILFLELKRAMEEESKETFFVNIKEEFTASGVIFKEPLRLTTLAVLYHKGMNRLNGHYFAVVRCSAGGWWLMDSIKARAVKFNSLLGAAGAGAGGDATCVPTMVVARRIDTEEETKQKDRESQTNNPQPNPNSAGSSSDSGSGVNSANFPNPANAINSIPKVSPSLFWAPSTSFAPSGQKFVDSESVRRDNAEPLRNFFGTPGVTTQSGINNQISYRGATMTSATVPIQMAPADFKRVFNATPGSASSNATPMIPEDPRGGSAMKEVTVAGPSRTVVQNWQARNNGTGINSGLPSSAAGSALTNGANRILSSPYAGIPYTHSRINRNPPPSNANQTSLNNAPFLSPASYSPPLQAKSISISGMNNVSNQSGNSHSSNNLIPSALPQANTSHLSRAAAFVKDLAKSSLRDHMSEPMTSSDPSIRAAARFGEQNLKRFSSRAQEVQGMKRNEQMSLQLFLSPDDPIVKAYAAKAGRDPVVKPVKGQIGGAESESGWTSGVKVIATGDNLVMVEERTAGTDDSQGAQSLAFYAEDIVKSFDVTINDVKILISNLSDIYKAAAFIVKFDIVRSKSPLTGLSLNEISCGIRGAFKNRADFSDLLEIIEEVGGLDAAFAPVPRNLRKLSGLTVPLLGDRVSFALIIRLNHELKVQIFGGLQSDSEEVDNKSKASTSTPVTLSTPARLSLSSARTVERMSAFFTLGHAPLNRPASTVNHSVDEDSRKIEITSSLTLGDTFLPCGNFIKKSDAKVSSIDNSRLHHKLIMNDSGMVSVDRTIVKSNQHEVVISSLPSQKCGFRDKEGKPHGLASDHAVARAVLDDRKNVLGGSRWQEPTPFTSTSIRRSEEDLMKDRIRRWAVTSTVQLSAAWQFNNQYVNTLISKAVREECMLASKIGIQYPAPHRRIFTGVSNSLFYMPATLWQMLVPDFIGPRETMDGFRLTRCRKNAGEIKKDNESFSIRWWGCTPVLVVEPRMLDPATDQKDTFTVIADSRMAMPNGKIAAHNSSSSNHNTPAISSVLTNRGLPSNNPSDNPSLCSNPYTNAGNAHDRVVGLQHFSQAQVHELSKMNLGSDAQMEGSRRVMMQSNFMVVFASESVQDGEDIWLPKDSAAHERIIRSFRKQAPMGNEANEKNQREVFKKNHFPFVEAHKPPNSRSFRFVCPLPDNAPHVKTSSGRNMPHRLPCATQLGIGLYEHHVASRGRVAARVRGFGGQLQANTINNENAPQIFQPESLSIRKVWEEHASTFSLSNSRGTMLLFDGNPAEWLREFTAKSSTSDNMALCRSRIREVASPSELISSAWSKDIINITLHPLAHRVVLNKMCQGAHLHPNSFWAHFLASGTIPNSPSFSDNSNRPGQSNPPFHHRLSLLKRSLYPHGQDFLPVEDLAAYKLGFKLKEASIFSLPARDQETMITIGTWGEDIRWGTREIPIAEWIDAELEIIKSKVLMWDKIHERRHFGRRSVAISSLLSVETKEACAAAGGMLERVKLANYVDTCGITVDTVVEIEDSLRGLQLLQQAVFIAEMGFIISSENLGGLFAHELTQTLLEIAGAVEGTTFSESSSPKVLIRTPFRVQRCDKMNNPGLGDRINLKLLNMEGNTNRVEKALKSCTMVILDVSEIEDIAEAWKQMPEGVKLFSSVVGPRNKSQEKLPMARIRKYLCLNQSGREQIFSAILTKESRAFDTPGGSSVLFVSEFLCRQASGVYSSWGIELLSKLMTSGAYIYWLPRKWRVLFFTEQSIIKTNHKGIRCRIEGARHEGQRGCAAFVKEPADDDVSSTRAISIPPNAARSLIVAVLWSRVDSTNAGQELEGSGIVRGHKVFIAGVVNSEIQLTYAQRGLNFSPSLVEGEFSDFKEWYHLLNSGQGVLQGVIAWEPWDSKEDVIDYWNMDLEAMTSEASVKVMSDNKKLVQLNNPENDEHLVDPSNTYDNSFAPSPPPLECMSISVARLVIATAVTQVLTRWEKWLLSLAPFVVAGDLNQTGQRLETRLERHKASNHSTHPEWKEVNIVKAKHLGHASHQVPREDKMLFNSPDEAIFLLRGMLSSLAQLLCQKLPVADLLFKEQHFPIVLHLMTDAGPPATRRPGELQKILMNSERIRQSKPVQKLLVVGHGDHVPVMKAKLRDVNWSEIRKLWSVVQGEEWHQMQNQILGRLKLLPGVTVSQESPNEEIVILKGSIFQSPHNFFRLHSNLPFLSLPEKREYVQASDTAKVDRFKAEISSKRNIRIANRYNSDYISSRTGKLSSTSIPVLAFDFYPPGKEAVDMGLFTSDPSSAADSRPPKAPPRKDTKPFMNSLTAKPLETLFLQPHRSYFEDILGKSFDEVASAHKYKVTVEILHAGSSETMVNLGIKRGDQGILSVIKSNGSLQLDSPKATAAIVGTYRINSFDKNVTWKEVNKEIQKEAMGSIKVRIGGNSTSSTLLVTKLPQPYKLIDEVLSADFLVRAFASLSLGQSKVFTTDGWQIELLIEGGYQCAAKLISLIRTKLNRLLFSKGKDGKGIQIRIEEKARENNNGLIIPTTAFLKILEQIGGKLRPISTGDSIAVAIRIIMSLVAKDMMKYPSKNLSRAIGGDAFIPVIHLINKVMKCAGTFIVILVSDARDAFLALSSEDLYWNAAFCGCMPYLLIPLLSIASASRAEYLVLGNVREKTAVNETGDAQGSFSAPSAFTATASSAVVLSPPVAGADAELYLDDLVHSKSVRTPDEADLFVKDVLFALDVLQSRGLIRFDVRKMKAMILGVAGGLQKDWEGADSKSTWDGEKVAYQILIRLLGWYFDNSASATALSLALIFQCRKLSSPSNLPISCDPLPLPIFKSLIFEKLVALVDYYAAPVIWRMEFNEEALNMLWHAILSNLNDYASAITGARGTVRDSLVNFVIGPVDELWEDWLEDLVPGVLDAALEAARRGRLLILSRMRKSTFWFVFFVIRTLTRVKKVACKGDSIVDEAPVRIQTVINTLTKEVSTSWSSKSPAPPSVMACRDLPFISTPSDSFADSASVRDDHSLPEKVKFDNACISIQGLDKDLVKEFRIKVIKHVHKAINTWNQYKKHLVGVGGKKKVMVIADYGSVGDRGYVGISFWRVTTMYRLLVAIRVEAHSKETAEAEGVRWGFIALFVARWLMHSGSLVESPTAVGSENLRKATEFFGFDKVTNHTTPGRVDEIFSPRIFFAELAHSEVFGALTDGGAVLDGFSTCGVAGLAAPLKEACIHAALMVKKFNKEKEKKKRNTVNGSASNAADNAAPASPPPHDSADVNQQNMSNCTIEHLSSIHFLDFSSLREFVEFERFKQIQAQKRKKNKKGGGKGSNQKGSGSGQAPGGNDPHGNSGDVSADEQCSDWEGRELMDFLVSFRCKGCAAGSGDCFHHLSRPTHSGHLMVDRIAVGDFAIFAGCGMQGLFSGDILVSVILTPLEYPFLTPSSFKLRFHGRNAIKNDKSLKSVTVGVAIQRIRKGWGKGNEEWNGNAGDSDSTDSTPVDKLIPSSKIAEWLRPADIAEGSAEDWSAENFMREHFDEEGWWGGSDWNPGELDTDPQFINFVKDAKAALKKNSMNEILLEREKRKKERYQERAGVIGEISSDDSDTIEDDE